MARAGRSGSAFSLISPDEIAYMLDLHLFIGRGLKLSGDDGENKYNISTNLTIVYKVVNINEG